MSQISVKARPHFELLAPAEKLASISLTSELVNQIAELEVMLQQRDEMTFRDNLNEFGGPADLSKIRNLTTWSLTPHIGTPLSEIANSFPLLARSIHLAVSESHSWYPEDLNALDRAIGDDFYGSFSPTELEEFDRIAKRTMPLVFERLGIKLKD